jgi:hypothetical protein
MGSPITDRRKTGVMGIVAMLALAIDAQACGQTIVEPGPSIAVITGHVTDDAGHAVAGARIRIYLDPLDQLPAPGAPHHQVVDTVTIGDGSFERTVLVGGVGPFSGQAVVVAVPPDGKGLRMDSVTGPVDVRHDPPYDTLHVTIVLTPEMIQAIPLSR